MSSKIRNVALLFPALALATLAYAEKPGLKISQVDSSGQLTNTTFDPSNGVAAKAPSPGPNGTFKYWDGLSATNFYNQANYIAAPPNPQIAVGPDDILTIVNRTIARYANPNAAGNVGATNPYSNPPTHQVFLDAWIGISGGNLTNLCPAQGQFGTCVLDNASIRYDQLQGRFVVLMTVTDLEFHLSNWVMLVSRWANFACSTTGGGPAAACPFTSDIFTPPIVQNFGGPAIGGVNGNWVAYVIPINVFIPTGGIPTGNITAGAPFCALGAATGGVATGPTGSLPGISSGFGFGGTPASAPPGGGTQAWNNGPGNAPLTAVSNNCTNYYPTDARMGIDNDNILLVSPVLDQTQTVFGPSGGAGLPGGAYAGTRVTSVPKLVVYNGTALPLSGGANFTTIITSGFGVGLGAINLSDDTRTGTLVGGLGNDTLGNQVNPIPGIVSPTGLPAGTANPGFLGGYTQGLVLSNIRPIFWEPDNVRGRALASFDSQVGVSSCVESSCGHSVQGVITPLDYLVGIEVPGLPGGLHANATKTNFWIQPVVFSCPATAIFSAPAGVTFCGTAGALGTQVPDVPTLGVRTELLGTGGAGTVTQTPRTNANALVYYGDPALVGQGPSTSSPSPSVAPSGLLGTLAGAPRMYVGDSRPQQVIFREGLLYVARVAQTMDLNTNVVTPSTVVYDIIKQVGPTCQTNGALGLGGPGPFCTVPTGGACPNATSPGCTASPYSTTGITIPNPVTILETQWYNGTTPSPCPAGTGTGPANFQGQWRNDVVYTVGQVVSFGNSLYTSILNTGTGASQNLNRQPDISPTFWQLLVVSSGSSGTPCDPNSYGFYAPMFDSPANVIGGLATSSQPISPISLFPWLEKLFVGMTTGGTANLAGTFSTNNPSLWDFRPGDDAYDSSLTVIDPVDGRHKGTTNDPYRCNIFNNGFQGTGSPAATCPVIPFGTRGGASTDPNDGSLWLYGAFAKKRFSQINAGPGVWGTSVANYALDFPATDPYNNDNSYFSDVQPGTNGFFTWIQIAKNVGIAFAKSTGPSFCPGNPGGNPPIIPPPIGNAGGGTTPGASQNCNIFGPSDFVTRSEMSKWIVLAQMDEAQVTAYLNASGGQPDVNNNRGSSFADVLTDPNIRYIETMYRRGYTKGCPNTADILRKYCPTDLVTRGQMAVFVIRAKMSNVFPTTLSGIPLTGVYGDNFGTFLGVNPNGVAIGPNGTFASGQYFQDEPTTDGFFLYIQKMRELRITNGTGTSPACPTGPCYSPLTNITRQELATFIVRAFFL